MTLPSILVYFFGSALPVVDVGGTNDVGAANFDFRASTAG
jgi:hypothetical protein